MTKHFQKLKQKSSRITCKKVIGSFLLFLMSGIAVAQTDTAETFKPHGQLWGAAFGDFAYKNNADILGRGANQYTGVPTSTNMFQWRRIYLGYNYWISPKFSVEFLLSSENDYAANLLGQAPNTINTTTGAVTLGGNGDILMNNKFAPFVKWANLRWKNIWKGTDLVFGQVNNPSVGINGRNQQTSEEVWAYRSIEKTVDDIRGTPVYDFGAELQGWFDSRGNFGYDLMVGNGQAARPENDLYKWFYGDVYAKFFNKRLVIDLYQDYEKLNWGVFTKGLNGPWHHDRNMTKLFAAWNTEKFTVGFEGFTNTLLGDVKVTGKDGNTYYRTTKALDMSLFVRGRILSDHKGNARLGYFARYDNYDPSGDLGSIINNGNTKSYVASTAAYDPTTKEQFVVLGFDYTPAKHVHFMPNVELNTYNSTVSQSAANDLLNPAVSGIKGTDVVWRLTFWYVYGK